MPWVEFDSRIDEALAAAGITREDWQKLGEWSQNQWLSKGHAIINSKEYFRKIGIEVSQ